MELAGKCKSFLFRGENAAYFWRIREKAKNSRGRLGRAYYAYKLHRLAHKMNACVPLSAEIAGMPLFPHNLYGVFISSSAKIGSGCIIFHQVTIGSNTLRDSKGAGAPTIGDNVFIGAGAKIIGNLKVGDNVRIGANCVVVEDVPANSTVVSAASRVIPHSKPKDNSFRAQILRK